MKHFFSTTLLCMILVVSGVSAEPLPDGADLFIEAERCRGVNHTLFRSLKLIMEQSYQTPSLTAEDVEPFVKDWEKQRDEVLKINPNMKPWYDETREEVALRFMRIEPVFSRFTILYKAPSFTRRQMSMQIERLISAPEEEPKRWEAELKTIEGNTVTTRSDSEGAIWFPQAKSARVTDDQAYMDAFLNFGRLQGPDVNLVLMMLLQDQDVEKYAFSEKNIAQFKAERQKKMRSDNVKILQTVGTSTYDGNATAYIVESSKDGKVQERYHIDTARGYICPLLQYYDASGKLRAEYRSSGYFLHKKSGLWFPLLHKEMTMDPTNGKPQFKEYTIDKDSVDINFPVADDEFVLEIPSGATVIDERAGKRSKRYIAAGDGVLSLGEDGLDLEKQTWLLATEPTPQPPRWMAMRIVSFCFGLLLVIIGLYLRFHRPSRQER